MLKLTDLKNGELLVETSLPTGKTQEELVAELDKEMSDIEAQFYGKNVLINGRITTAMSLYLGHRLAHISKTVSVFDPKEGTYVKTVWH